MREIIYEFIPQGRYVRVTAMDPATLTEVAIVGDAASGKDKLRETAARKLDYVLAKAKKPSRAAFGLT
ncbi:DUF6898 family protein [Rhodovibrio salinarum]|uniref:DUF6898 domain-containing protein n=1 Tax=Rhodovibrio salinarum TaxID=1087 RepID=A0A934V064_9PROT|nr:hypothetical protein [Rhodovibrio salinarum]MBK1697917.1 hypothetical protein [Rhodovibrio salinarum]